MSSIEWRAPAPLWSGSGVEQRRPWLAELATDDFVPEFVGLMEGRQAPERQPADLIALAPQLTENSLKLYQPLHGRYYLATGTLVCRQLGLPDRTVAPQNGERVTFVLRRIDQAGGALEELAWVNDGPNRGWQPLLDARSRPVTIRADEERLPLHPVTVCASPTAATLTDPFKGGCGHVVYYGYIPVGSRTKYEAPPPSPPAADTAAVLQTYVADVQGSVSSSADKTYDFRLDEIDSRVIGPWYGVLTANNPLDKLQGSAAAKLPEFSLYLIVDLANFLSNYLPSVFQAVIRGTALPAGSQRRALVDDLDQITVQRNGQARSLAAAIGDLQDKLGLANGLGQEPSDIYNVRDVTVPGGGNAGAYFATTGGATPFKTLIRGALKEEPAPPTVSQDLVDLLRSQVRPTPAPEQEQQYILRLVYEHAPCEPVLSDASQPFYLARLMDPDAPARHIRLELPSIKMQDLRKYKPSVGLQMPPELRRLMARVNKDMLQGKDLGADPGGFELAMICSFSLQIIFLVAFIVMFIFLIALNFIFWWLPFLKICFPVPKAK
jgi:hypothetical protein